MTFDGLIGLFGPRDMSAAARDRIAADIRAVASDPVVLTRLTATGQVAAPGTAAEFAASIEEQSTAVKDVARNIQHAAQGAAHVSANILNVNRGAGETDAASSQVLSSAQALAGESARLKLEVDKFLATVRAA